MIVAHDLFLKNYFFIIVIVFLLVIF